MRPGSGSANGIDQAAEAGQRLTEEYTDPRTQRIQRRRRPELSNSPINKVLAAVRTVLKEGKRHGWIEQNPLDGSDCFLPQNAARRSLLEVAGRGRASGRPAARR